MSTPISNFRWAVRVLIGDDDPDINLIEDAQIDRAMRLQLDVGRVVGDQVTVSAYTFDDPNITPDLTAAADPKAFAQLIYYAAKLFVADVQSQAWRTRAFSETRGDNIQKVFHIVEELYGIENGQMSNSTDYD